MSDHRAVIKALPAEARLGLTRLSDLRGFTQLAGHLGALGFCSVLIAFRLPFWGALILPQGILLVFLFTAHHEMIHRTAFARRGLNDAFARLCGFLILLPSDWFRYFHAAHHRHTQDPARDPELATPKPETLGQYLRHVSGLPVWKGQVATLLRNASGARDVFVPEGARGRIRREARLMLIGYGLVFALALPTRPDLLLTLWLGPLLVGQPFLRLYLLAEHGRCPFVADMLANSRTTFTSALIRRLAWNMPYHAEHHSLPGVPFHRLPNLHALIRDRLKVTERGYLRFHRAYLGAFGRPGGAFRSGK